MPRISHDDQTHANDAMDESLIASSRPDLASHRVYFWQLVSALLAWAYVMLSITYYYRS